MSAACPVDILTVRAATPSENSDFVAVEEPLELRLGTAPFATIMRTPGDDRELAAGFLLAERIIAGASEVASIHHATDEDGNTDTNALDVWLAGDAALRAAVRTQTRRHVAAGAACGVCGRQTIADLVASIRPIESDAIVPASVLALLSCGLRRSQRTFDRTGGLHAAGLFTQSGVLSVCAEDVGRHNAVDKVIGRELLAGRLPLSSAILFVSGRTSFEIVQKAAVAGIPVIGAVSAPSSLAVSLARAANITLCGFVREERFNVYTCAERIAV
jgi:FdhD protein